MTLPFVPNGRVTLITDFGDADGYVGAMKGVIYRGFGGAAVTDIAHHVPAQSIISGSQAAATACPYFPPGTVHVVVVDPGVGSARAPMALVSGGHCFIGPDNGVLIAAASVLSERFDAYRIDRVFGVASATFHGRDIFAPAAAAIASGGLVPSELGPSIVPIPCPMPAPMMHNGVWMAQVVRVDHFGNAITNFKAEREPRPLRAILPNGHGLTVLSTYSDVAAGRPLALLGSEGWLEVAIRDGSAAETLGLEPGSPIRIIVD